MWIRGGRTRSVVYIYLAAQYSFYPKFMDSINFGYLLYVCVIFKRSEETTRVEDERRDSAMRSYEVVKVVVCKPKWYNIYQTPNLNLQ